LSASDRKPTSGGGERRGKADRRRGADRRASRERRAREIAAEEEERRIAGARRAVDRRTGHDRRTETGWQLVSIEDASTGTYDHTALVAAAVDARQYARARFSGFKVGAALETSAGHVITGCNIENATYGLTMCAERVALYKALSDGRDIFTRIAVVADTADPTPPCGSCRQLLWEYCGDVEVILANLSEVKRRMRLSELLPLPFDARLLE
jgi:cytidine deaminase